MNAALQKKSSDFVVPQIQLQMYEHRATRLVAEISALMESDLASGKSFSEAWNAIMSESYRITKAHCFLIMVKSFIEAVDSAPQELKEILSVLRDLFALYYVEKDLADFLEDGYITAQQGNQVRQHVRRLLGVVRRDAVPLVDAFNLSDMYLNSALGKYDGKVYEALYEWAQKEPLNKTDVTEAYEKYIRPMLKSNL